MPNNVMAGGQGNAVYTVTKNSGSLNSILNPFDDITKNAEQILINTATKSMITGMLFIWLMSFIALLLSFGALAYLFIIFWIYWAIVLFKFANLWSLYGYSVLLLCLSTVLVLGLEILISIGIHSLIL